jgi:hypothetical protein
MNDSTVSDFIEMLVKNKKYIKEQIVLANSYSMASELPFFDLVLRSKDKDKVLALVKFVKQDEKDLELRNEIIRIRNLKNPLIKDVVIFLVITKENKNVEYFEVRNDKLIEHNKSTLPSAEDIENRINDQIEIRYKEKIDKQKELFNKIKATSSYTILLIAITATLITFITIVKPIDNEEKNAQLIKMDHDLYRMQKEIDKINGEYDVLQKRIEFNSNNSGNYEINTAINKVGKNIIQQDSRITNLQNDIGNVKEILNIDPIKAYMIKDIKTSLDLLQKEVQNNKQLVDKDIDNFNDKYNLIIGLLIAIFATIIVLTIPNIIKPKIDSQIINDKKR